MLFTQSSPSQRSEPRLGCNPFRQLSAHQRALKGAHVRPSDGPFGIQAQLLAARRSSHQQASTSNSAALETRPDVSEQIRQLASAAKAGQPHEAQIVLQGMVSQGLNLTPQAFHGLIFSYMRARDSDAAVNALYSAIESSALKPLAASYAVAIYACALNSDFQGAETVYNLVASSADRHPSWLAYLKGLVAAGLAEMDSDEQLEVMEQVEKLLEEGERQGWYPDLDLYEEIFGLFCEDPKKAIVAEDMLQEVLERREGAETRHYNCILRAQAVFMGVHNARKLMDDMIEGRTGGKHRVLPNIGSYNALIEGCLVERMQGFSYAVEDLEAVIAETITVGIQANKRTHTLLLIFYQLEGNLDVRNRARLAVFRNAAILSCSKFDLTPAQVARVLYELREMERLSAPGRVTEHLSNVWLGRVVDFMLNQKCVLEVARLLFILNKDGRSLPADVFCLDEEGQSFHTRWLPTFFAGQHFGRRNEDLEKYQEDEELEEEDAMLMDDTYLNVDNTAINERTGQELSVSDMSASQMKAELEAKGLSSTGLKSDLSRRVQHSRGNQPVPVREAMRRRQAEVEAVASADTEARAQNEVLQSLQSVARYTSQWARMSEPSNIVDTETYVIDPAKEERELDREHLASLESLKLTPEVKDLLKEWRNAFNTKDVESEFYYDTLIFDTETPEFRILNPNFHGREGYGERLTWPMFGKAARLAFYMMEMAESLGGGASIKDFVEIQAACLEEEDPDTAFALLFKFHPYAEEVEPSVRELFYNKTLLLCTQTDRLDLASAVGEAMQALDIEPQGILGNERTLSALRDYGTGVHRLIRDLRLDSEGLYEDPEVDEEAKEAEDRDQDVVDSAVSEAGSSDEEIGEVWEQGIEEDDELMRPDSDEDPAHAELVEEGEVQDYEYEYEEGDEFEVLDEDDLAELLEEDEDKEVLVLPAAPLSPEDVEGFDVLAAEDEDEEDGEDSEEEDQEQEDVIVPDQLEEQQSEPPQLPEPED